MIIPDVGAKVGLGHFTRSKILSDEINFYFKKKFLVKELFFSHEKKINKFFKPKSSIFLFINDLKARIEEYNPNIIFLNNSNLFAERFGLKLINYIKFNFEKIKSISIDSYFKCLKI